MSLLPLGYISQGGGAGGGGYELISTTILGSNTNTVTLSSIPATYKHLKVIISGRSSFAATGQSNVYMRMNGDSSSSYWYHNMTLTSGSFYAQNAGSTTTQGQIGYNTQNNSASGYWGAYQIDVPDYTSTSKHKVARINSRMDADNGTNYAEHGGVLYMSTAAVSSLSFYMDQGDWIANSRFSVYGLSG